MKSRLQITTSTLALILLLTTPNTHSAETPEAPETYKKTTLTSPELMVDVIQDTYPDSESATYFAHKTPLSSSSEPPQNHKRRILGINGGGARGLLPIIILTVLEEIMNSSTNKQSLFSYHYIRDFFDVGAGTSTGSILTAGLFSTRNYTAIDLARVYAYRSPEIFDHHKRGLMPGFNIGLTCATYDNRGLQDLLSEHFGNGSLGDVHKPIYVIALNENKQEVAIFNHNVQDSLDLHKTPLVQALLCSASAPIFFPAVQLETLQGFVQMSDGGAVANNPVCMAYKEERKHHTGLFEIYSFGTGAVPSPAPRHPDSGATSIGPIFSTTLAATEKLSFGQCAGDIKTPSSPLDYFAWVNPKLEAGMGEMDNTTKTYRDYAIEKALSVTKGAAFADMVKHLGLRMPNENELTQIHETIHQKLNALTSKTYDTLYPYEKERVIEKVLGLDFRFYENLQYQDPDKIGALKKMTDEEANAFLGTLMTDIAEKKKTEGWISKLWEMALTSNDNQILEFIPRCQDFHKLSNQKPLTLENFTLLTNQECQLTQQQLQDLSPNHRINGDGLVFSGSNAEETETNKLVSDLFLRFTQYCNEGEKYQYPNHNSSYIHLPALIFWKDALKNIENQVTKEQLTTLKDHLNKNVLEIMGSRALVSPWIADKTFGSRYRVLVDALGTYIDKFCTD